MRDVYLSDPFERIASMAIGNGVLITRNGPQHALRHLEPNELELLARKLDEQKQHFLSQVKSQVETYVEEESELSRLLPKECLSALRKYVSLSLSHLECHLRDLSVAGVRTEILLAWLEPDSSSFPSSDEQRPADSHSAGHTESVAVSNERQAELKEQDSHDCLETFVIPFIKRLSGDDLAAINAGVIPTPLMKLMCRIAYNEIERRRDA